MRQQWFTHVRLLIAHPPRYSETSPAALTTPALDRRSLRWFGISACTATPEDLPPSLAQHGSCRRSSTSSSSLPFRTHVGAGNSAVVVDLPRCGPMLSPRVPNLVPIVGITGSARCALRPLEGPRDHRVAPPTRCAAPTNRPTGAHRLRPELARRDRGRAPAIAPSLWVPATRSWLIRPHVGTCWRVRRIVSILRLRGARVAGSAGRAAPGVACHRSSPTDPTARSTSDHLSTPLPTRT